MSSISFIILPFMVDSNCAIGFYVRPNESVQKAMLFRFAVCREDETLDVACKRLKKLQEYMSPSVSA